jgi:hypothetical protein
MPYDAVLQPYYIKAEGQREGLFLRWWVVESRP